jgi:hypothetical protein
MEILAEVSEVSEVRQVSGRVFSHPLSHAQTLLLQVSAERAELCEDASVVLRVTRARVFHVRHLREEN